DQATVSTKPSESQSTVTSGDERQTEGTAPPHAPPAARRPVARNQARRGIASERRGHYTLGRSTVLTDRPGGAKNALLTTIAAIVIVSLAVGLYVYLGEKPPVATGEVTKMWVYSVHTKTRPFIGEGASGDPTSFDQVLILAQVKLRNQS